MVSRSCKRVRENRNLNRRQAENSIMNKTRQRHWRNSFYLLICMMAWAALSGCGKSRIGMDNGNLMPCPASPNCVSSHETDPSRSVEPLRYTVPRKQAWDAVLSILNESPRARVVTTHDNYIHAEFRSRVFGFVDDMEFFFDDAAPLIHVRSASRIGYSDLGVNRKRVEAFRERFMQLCPIIPEMEMAR